MALEVVREKLKDALADLSSKIQENSAFNNLREKFEGQPPTVQRAILAGIAFMAFLFLISFPWSYISESQDHMTYFEENRGLIQGLLRASRAAKEPSPLPAPIGADTLKSFVQSALTENRLIPDQIGDMQADPGKPAKDLAPAVVVQSGLNVQLKKLNLDQVIALSHKFQTLAPGTKLMGLEIIQTAGQTHYYDMVAHIVNFGLPVTIVEEPTDNKRPGKGGKKPPKRKTEEEPVD